MSSLISLENPKSVKMIFEVIGHQFIDYELFYYLKIIFYLNIFVFSDALDGLRPVANSTKIMKLWHLRLWFGLTASCRSKLGKNPM